MSEPRRMDVRDEEMERLRAERDTARNRVAALEKNGTELLARAEAAETERDEVAAEYNRATDAYGALNSQLIRAENERDEMRRLLDTALNIRMYGERAPGGNENWRDWEQAASALLYPEALGGES